LDCNVEFYYVGKISRTGIGRPSKQRRVLLRRRNTVVGCKCALPSAHLVRYASRRIWNHLPDSLRSTSILLRFTSSCICQVCDIVTMHSRHPLLTHSFTPGSTSTFSTNPFHRNRLLVPKTAFTDTGLDLSCSMVCFQFIFRFFSVWLVD